MELALASPPNAPAKQRRRAPHRTTRPQLLARSQLDGRTGPARAFDRLVGAVESDLGGHDQLSAIELALVQAFAGAAITLDGLNARLLLGEEIDGQQHAQAVSAMVRVASRLGLARRAREVGPTLSDYLRRPSP